MNSKFMDKLNIKISLANRLYPMSINGSEEKLIRLSASKIEKILKTLKEKYSVKDYQDLLAMCALQFCVEIEKNKLNHAQNEQSVVQDLSELNKLISDLL
jgi:cell division protein ZapA